MFRIHKCEDKLFTLVVTGTTEDWAVLYDLTSRISGDPATTYRGSTDSLFEAMVENIPKIIECQNFFSGQLVAMPKDTDE